MQQNSACVREIDLAPLADMRRSVNIATTCLYVMSCVGLFIALTIFMWSSANQSPFWIAWPMVFFCIIFATQRLQKAVANGNRWAILTVSVCILTFAVIMLVLLIGSALLKAIYGLDSWASFFAMPAIILFALIIINWLFPIFAFVQEKFQEVNLKQIASAWSEMAVYLLAFLPDFHTYLFT